MSMYGIATAFCGVGLATILTVIGWWIYIRISPFHVIVNKIPGPSFYLPFIGNSLEFAGSVDHVIHTFQDKWAKKYGEIYRVFIGTQCHVLISSPELLEMIFSNQKIFEKSSLYNYLLPWTGKGIFISSGNLWRSRRKLLTPAFHFSILNNFVEIFNEQSRVLCRVIDDTCKSFPEGKAEIDVYPIVTRCTLDIICETAMGTKLNAQTTDSEYVRAVSRLGQILVQRFQRPWLMNQKIFNFSVLGREHDKLIKIIHSFVDGVIHKRQKLFNQMKVDNKTKETETGISGKKLPFLDLLLKASEDGKFLTNQDIRNETNTFMFAGHDTTSSLISWFLYVMASNQDCQEKVWEELQNTFGSTDRDCSLNDLPNLKYLECCIKETLRIYPSAPAFERVVREDVRIGNYLIPAGSSVACLLLATHRNPRIFPDPLVFRPERFYPNETIGRHPYAYVPFSAGPRNCIGQRFAMLQSKVVLSTLLRHFKFELSPSAKPPILANQIILKSLNGINLIVSRQ